MKTIKRFFLLALCALFFANVHNLSAQVTIGSEQEPNVGALLDLKENSDGSSAKGFNLPRVALTSLTSLEPCMKNATDTDKANHKGLQVYNIGTDFAEGVYTWNGAKWLSGGNFTMDLNSIHVDKTITTTISYDGIFDVVWGTLTITRPGLYFLRGRITARSTADDGMYFTLKTTPDHTSVYTVSVNLFTTNKSWWFSGMAYLSAGVYSAHYTCGNDGGTHTINYGYALFSATFVRP